MGERLGLEVTDDVYRLKCSALHPGDPSATIEIVRAVDDTPTASILALLGYELQDAARDINQVDFA